MDEKETTQVEQETQTEDVKPQPTVEELQGRIQELASEVERKEGVIQSTKKELREVIRRGGSRAEVDALSKKIDDVQGEIAGWLDDLANRISGEEAPPAKKSYKAEYDAKKSAEPKKEVDPAAQRFFDYLAEEGLDFDDDIVQETIKGTETPQQALKAMKEKVKTMEQDKIEELADKKAAEKVNLAVEKALRDRGLFDQGAGTPSGSASSFEKVEQDFADGKISYEDYTKARKEQGL